MCQLCSNDLEERESARISLLDKASDLRRLAACYENLAAGYIKPHSTATDLMTDSARAVIRFLVEEWV